MKSRAYAARLYDVLQSSLTAAEFDSCIRALVTSGSVKSWVYSDGGRAEAGFTDKAPGDCVTRAIAIATGLPYRTVYDRINILAARERPRQGRRRSAANRGVIKDTWKQLLIELGWEWVPTMHIGSGCTVHLCRKELPSGHLIVQVSKHIVAVIDGLVFDDHDSTRDSRRCVYGYYKKVNA